MQYLKIMACAALSLALVACGGGGGNPGTPTGSTVGTGGTGGTTTTAPVPARLDLSVGGSLTTVNSATVTITAQVVDSTSSAIGSQAVTFAADSGVLSGATPKTSAAGVATATLSAGGSDKSNRTIKVTVTAGAISGVISVPVTGTTLSLSGVSSLLIGGPAVTYTVQARDAGNVPIAGQTLVATSSLGNTLSSAAATDANGNTSFTLTPTKAGSDTLTVTGLGTAAPALAVSVSATNFTVLAPAASGSNVNVNPDTSLNFLAADQKFTVLYLLNGAPVVGQAVNFSTTRGTLSVSSVLTDSSGQASVQVKSSSAGVATLSASIGAGASVSTGVQFVATTPATVKIQATPTAIPPNSSGSTTNQSSLLATVRDASGNPVSGATVNFSATDPSNGSIAPASGTTDSNGQVKASFTSGAVSTATDGVVLAASVAGTPPISSTTNLTVSGQALFINIGYGNTITTDSPTNPTKYVKTFSAYVTDSNGAAVNGQVLTLSVYPNAYGKGTLSTNGSIIWSYSPGSPTSCLNEDVNKNGQLEAGEDTNHNGKLDPGEPIVVSPGQVTTDSTGYARFTLSYGEQFTHWLFAVDIVAKGVVSGTESRNTLTVPVIWGLASDYFVATGTPADAISPFGTSTDCTQSN